MIADRPRDWFKFWVHFVCGFLVGGLIGFWLFCDLKSGWLAVGGVVSVGLVVGLLAGIYLDAFWERFLEWLGGWW